MKQSRVMLNCKTFINELEGVLSREYPQVGVLMLDLDRFRLVNEVAGHAVGECLLAKVAQRLQLYTPDRCIWANYWGDKFFAAIPATDGEAEIHEVTGSILQACRQPWLIDGREFFLSVGIGMAIYPQHGTDAVRLMKHADLALSQAKEKGSNTCQLYNNAFMSKVTQLFKVEEGLRRALGCEQGEGEFYLEYQPRANLHTGVIDAAEALVRWRSPQLGHLAPLEFIKVAENSGLIIKLGTWVLKQACRQAALWQQDGQNIRVSVNLSAYQLYDEKLPGLVADILQQCGLSPDKLELEITESMLMVNQEVAIAVLSRLKGLGVIISLDDFGTGYSSLATLQDLPIDILKIDKMFIKEAAASCKSRSIVEAVISLGHIMDIKVTAEGVEHSGQMSLLQQYGCDEAQGFFLARPLSAAALTEFLEVQSLDAPRRRAGQALNAACL